MMSAGPLLIERRAFKVSPAQLKAAELALRVIEQLIVPPLLIHRLGAGTMGQWVVLQSLVAVVGLPEGGMQSIAGNWLEQARVRGRNRVLGLASGRILAFYALYLTLAVAGTAIYLLRTGYSHTHVPSVTALPWLIFLNANILISPISFLSGVFRAEGLVPLSFARLLVVRIVIVATEVSLLGAAHAGFDQFLEVTGIVTVVASYAALAVALPPIPWALYRPRLKRPGRAVLSELAAATVLKGTEALWLSLPVLALQASGAGGALLATAGLIRTLTSVGRQFATQVSIAWSMAWSQLFFSRDMARLRARFLVDAHKNTLISGFLAGGLFATAGMAMRLWTGRDWDLPLWMRIAAVGAALASSLSRPAFWFTIHTSQSRSLILWSAPCLALGFIASRLSVLSAAPAWAYCLIAVAEIYAAIAAIALLRRQVSLQISKQLILPALAGIIAGLLVGCVGRVCIQLAWGFTGAAI